MLCTIVILNPIHKYILMYLNFSSLGLPCANIFSPIGPIHIWRFPTKRVPKMNDHNENLFIMQRYPTKRYEPNFSRGYQAHFQNVYSWFCQVVLGSGVEFRSLKASSPGRCYGTWPVEILINQNKHCGFYFPQLL